MLWNYLDTAVDKSPDEKQRKVVSSLLSWGCCGRCVLRFLCEKQQHVFRKSLKELEDGFQEYLQSTPKDAPLTPETVDSDKPKDEEVVDAQEIKENPVSSVPPTPEAADTDKPKDKDEEVADEHKKEEDPAVKSETKPICVTCLGILQDELCSEAFLDKVYAEVKEMDHEYLTFFCALTTPVSLFLREHAIWILLSEILPDVYNTKSNEDLPNVKEVWKWCCGNSLGRRLGVKFDMKSPFEVDINFTHPGIDKECAFLFDLYPHTFARRKGNRHGWEIFTRANVSKAVTSTKDALFKKNYCCPPLVPDQLAVCEPIKCLHESTFFAGRYNKYSRVLSQTPWFIEGVRKSESSIEEYISIPLKEIVKSTETRFSSSGREDVDVKMLGRGRPFIVEVINPHRVIFNKEHMRMLQQKINSSTDEISVRDLQEITREDTALLKEGETEKVKHYSALCWCKDKINAESFTAINAMKDIVLKQKTPIRVLHRRPYACRERMVHSIAAEVIDDHFCLLKLVTQAGTYIKEFVHGDLGRTVPSMCSLLGTQCDILELNVTEVLLDWPEKVDHKEDA